MQRSKTISIRIALAGLALILAAPALAQPAGAAVTAQFGGRSLIVYVPAHLPPEGQRALVVVLHGGLGNAQRIEDSRSESGLNMDAVAEKDGFIVAYLNGTPVTLRLGPDVLGWNAGGGCCGQSAANNIDDVGYIQRAVGELERQYGVDPGRVFGMGHSNGAMMTQRMMCETSLYAAEVAISGPLETPGASCAAARGKRILAIHGADDANVPVAGGRGTAGVANVAWASEAESQQTFVNAGATYDLDIVAGADHNLDHINAAIQRSEGRSIQEKMAAFFGLAPAP